MMVISIQQSKPKYKSLSLLLVVKIGRASAANGFAKPLITLAEATEPGPNTDLETWIFSF